MTTKLQFSALDLKPELTTVLTDAGFIEATPIQELTLGSILAGEDIFAQAETGSGKTGAFAIPILEQILRDGKTGNIGAHESRYAVLSPTRELAQQTHKVFQQFGKSLGIESCCIVGGESMDKQKKLIGKGIHVLVATPGRFVDLIKQKVVSVANCKAMVFDEADRLFDMGFKKDIEFILSRAPKDRQLIMLSATTNMDVLSTAYKFHSHPKELKLNEDSLIVDHINHKKALISEEEKFPLLVNILRNKEDAYAIVFCNTQFQTHAVAEWLKLMDFKAKPISGKLAQNKRTSLMDEFRSKKIEILVCTDVAARGLDIKNVNLVINYDLPHEAANYVHRIGRTGRAGKEGNAISFCAYEDCENLDPIEELIEAKIESMELEDSDFATDVCRKPFIDKKTLQVGSPPSRNANTNTKTNHKTNTKRDKPMANRNDRPKVHTKREPRAPRVVSNTPRIDKRFFNAETYNAKNVSQEAMKYLRLQDPTLLGHEVVSTGSRKFLILGPKKKKLKFFIKPMYKKLILPFMIGLLKNSGLDLFVKIIYKSNKLTINFSGDDEGMLIENKFELLNSLEHLTITFLQSRIMMHRNLKIDFTCVGSNNKPKKRNNDDDLIKLVENARKKILKDNKPFKLKSLNSSDRRIIHQHLSNDKNLKSSSVGEGRFKQIVLSPKN